MALSFISCALAEAAAAAAAGHWGSRLSTGAMQMMRVCSISGPAGGTREVCRRQSGVCRSFCSWPLNARCQQCSATGPNCITNQKEERVLTLVHRGAGTLLGLISGARNCKVRQGRQSGSEHGRAKPLVGKASRGGRAGQDNTLPWRACAQTALLQVTGRPSEEQRDKAPKERKPLRQMSAPGAPRELLRSPLAHEKQ